MYHLSGISSLTNGRRSRSNSLASSSPPLSPSVLDFSEYVSRKCEKKLQRRVRLLSQKCNKQQAAISQLKQQLAAALNNRHPLTDVSNVMATALLDADAEAADTAEGEFGGAADDTADETGLDVLDGNDEEEEEEEAEEEGVEAEEVTAEGGQRELAAASDSEEAASNASEQQQELDDSIVQPQAEGQQHTTTEEAAVTNECVASPPCSPISAGRHKRARTDDSVQCNTELIDAQWKKAKEEEEDEDEDEHEQQSDEQHIDDQTTAALSADNAPSAAQPGVATLLPFKPAFLHPFPTSHAQMQGNNAGSVLTPYRGLMRPFPLAQLSQSPVRVPQPAL